tara:strand:+ start:629 stop:2422 length:1794 start_codon:yes stop_codon:yes gene_type:complete
MEGRIKILLILLLISFSISQEYKIQFSHIPIGQGVGLSDSILVSNSIGAVLSNNMSSDSFAVGAGFLQTTQSVFSEPPVISSFNLPDLILKTGQPTLITATLYDLNGINSVQLLLQKGADEEETSIPMFNIEDDEYGANIPDSLINIENFRARIVGVDNMEYSTSTTYQSSEIRFDNGELSMENLYSHYPEGIKRNRWKLISWPGKPKNVRLAVSELEDGHAFFDWNSIKNKYEAPKEIHLGKAYWFRHIYDEPVFFQEDTSTALQLENFVINLDRGWNLIGSPFAFPVTFKKDSNVTTPITYDKKGWTGYQNQLFPWNGYAVYTDINSAELTLVPFSDSDSSAGRTMSNGEWYINIKLESSNYINHSAEIGRRRYAKDALDMFDTPVFPEIDNTLSISMDLNGTKPFKYMRDVRTINESNGVWNLKLDAHKDEKKIFVSGTQRELAPGISTALIDIPRREIAYNFLEEGYEIIKESHVAYDLKLIVGDENFILNTSQAILNGIPEKFSLSQNYPNPFNPVTRMDYTLPKRSRVVISIYNVLGQEVKTIINREQEYGYHSITWDGIDNRGKQMSSGVYFARMNSESFSQTKKMLLVK